MKRSDTTKIVNKMFYFQWISSEGRTVEFYQILSLQTGCPR
jgi:hypothetical protein